ncbi:Cytochrome C biogenesis protein CcsA [Candidatus Nasuia deltocephalinicola]|nr:Cytochrome C biogenesis protein CcsA [Candidatus Nasuia deltocephalinicola]
MLKLIKPSFIILIKKNNCIKCHKINKKLEIPCYKSMSFRYLNNKFYKKYLFRKIKLGGIGMWGNLIMPKNKIRSIFIKFIVKWILKIKRYLNY